MGKKCSTDGLFSEGEGEIPSMMSIILLSNRGTSMDIIANFESTESDAGPDIDLDTVRTVRM